MELVNAFVDLLVSHRDLVTSHRPVRLRLDHPSMFMEDVLLPQRVDGHESLCGGFEYRVLCVALDARLPLKEFIALPAALDIVNDRGKLRTVCGIVTEVRAGDSDGGLASYQIVIRDMLAVMEKRTSTRVFRNLTEVEILYCLRTEWGHNSPALGSCFDVVTDNIFEDRQYPRREFTMQHNETDAAFIRRLLRRRGISWFFEPNPATDYPSHRMRLLNRYESVRENAAGTVRYHRDASTEERDTITAWSAVRTLQPMSATRHSWDYKHPWPHQPVTKITQLDHGAVCESFSSTLDDYQAWAPHAGDDHADLKALGELAMDRHDFETKCFMGEGSVRDFRAGEYFSLTGHPEIDRHQADDREFVITELHLAVQNNLPRDLADRVAKLFARSGWVHDDLGTRPVKMRFTAVRRGVPLTPAYDPRVHLPVVHMQSALVVGPEKEEVCCDQMGRVRIRFPATRERDHEHAAGCGASNTDRDSAWVRVASNWAGNGPGNDQCGALFLPRVGSEVLVAFMGGDPDKPVIVGQMFNQEGMPPEFTGKSGLPGNRYLSGIRSKEVQGGRRGNQLRFDDTKGEISAQLSSDHSAAQLNLGLLTDPRMNGYNERRGDGAELRAESAVAIRGGGGVLLSAKADAGGGQLSRNELIGTAAVLNAVAEQLAGLAQTHSGDEALQGELERLCEQVSNWDGAKAPAEIIAASAPEGMLLASEHNVAVGAQTSLDLLSAKDTHLAAGGNVFIRALRGVSLFAHKLGMKLIAASGDIVMQSHNGDIEITAMGTVKINAGKSIELQAPEIRLASRGAQVNYGDGKVIQQCKGTYSIKSVSFEHIKAGGGNAADFKFPNSKIATDERVVLFDSQTGKPVEGRRYRLELPDGSIVEGRTDSEGRTELVTGEEIGEIGIIIYPD